MSIQPSQPKSNPRAPTSVEPLSTTIDALSLTRNCPPKLKHTMFFNNVCYYFREACKGGRNSDDNFFTFCALLDSAWASYRGKNIAERQQAILDLLSMNPTLACYADGKSCLQYVKDLPREPRRNPDPRALMLQVFRAFDLRHLIERGAYNCYDWQDSISPSYCLYMLPTKASGLRHTKEAVELDLTFPELQRSRAPSASVSNPMPMSAVPSQPVFPSAFESQSDPVSSRTRGAYRRNSASFSSSKILTALTSLTPPPSLNSRQTPSFAPAPVEVKAPPLSTTIDARSLTRSSSAGLIKYRIFTNSLCYYFREACKGNEDSDDNFFTFCALLDSVWARSEGKDIETRQQEIFKLLLMNPTSNCYKDCNNCLQYVFDEFQPTERGRNPNFYPRDLMMEVFRAFDLRTLVEGEEYDCYNWEDPDFDWDDPDNPPYWLTMLPTKAFGLRHVEEGVELDPTFPELQRLTGPMSPAPSQQVFPPSLDKARPTKTSKRKAKDKSDKESKASTKKRKTALTSLPTSPPALSFSSNSSQKLLSIDTLTLGRKDRQNPHVPALIRKTLAEGKHIPSKLLNCIHSMLRRGVGRGSGPKKKKPVEFIIGFSLLNSVTYQHGVKIKNTEQAQEAVFKLLTADSTIKTRAESTESGNILQYVNKNSDAKAQNWMVWLLDCYGLRERVSQVEKFNFIKNWEGFSSPVPPSKILEAYPADEDIFREKFKCIAKGGIFRAPKKSKSTKSSGAGRKSSGKNTRNSAALLVRAQPGVLRKGRKTQPSKRSANSSNTVVEDLRQTLPPSLPPLPPSFLSSSSSSSSAMLPLPMPDSLLPAGSEIHAGDASVISDASPGSPLSLNLFDFDPCDRIPLPLTPLMQSPEHKSKKRKKSLTLLDDNYGDDVPSADESGDDMYASSSSTLPSASSSSLLFQASSSSSSAGPGFSFPATTFSPSLLPSIPTESNPAPRGRGSERGAPQRGVRKKPKTASEARRNKTSGASVGGDPWSVNGLPLALYSSATGYASDDASREIKHGGGVVEVVYDDVYSPPLPPGGKKYMGSGKRYRGNVAREPTTDMLSDMIPEVPLPSGAKPSTLLPGSYFDSRGHLQSLSDLRAGQDQGEAFVPLEPDSLLRGLGGEDVPLVGKESYPGGDLFSAMPTAVPLSLETSADRSPGSSRGKGKNFTLLGRRTPLPPKPRLKPKKQSSNRTEVKKQPREKRWSGREGAKIKRDYEFEAKVDAYTQQKKLFPSNQIAVWARRAGLTTQKKTLRFLLSGIGTKKKSCRPKPGDLIKAVVLFNNIFSNLKGKSEDRVAAKAAFAAFLSETIVTQKNDAEGEGGPKNIFQVVAELPTAARTEKGRSTRAKTALLFIVNAFGILPQIKQKNPAIDFDVWIAEMGQDLPEENSEAAIPVDVEKFIKAIGIEEKIVTMGKKKPTHGIGKGLTVPAKFKTAAFASRSESGAKSNASSLSSHPGSDSESDSHSESESNASSSSSDSDSDSDSESNASSSSSDSESGLDSESKREHKASSASPLASKDAGVSSLFSGPASSTFFSSKKRKIAAISRAAASAPDPAPVFTKRQRLNFAIAQPTGTGADQDASLDKTGIPERT